MRVYSYSLLTECNITSENKSQKYPLRRLKVILATALNILLLHLLLLMMTMMMMKETAVVVV